MVLPLSLPVFPPLPLSPPSLFLSSSQAGQHHSLGYGREMDAGRGAQSDQVGGGGKELRHHPCPPTSRLLHPAHWLPHSGDDPAYREGLAPLWILPRGVAGQDWGYEKDHKGLKRLHV